MNSHETSQAVSDYYEQLRNVYKLCKMDEIKEVDVESKFFDSIGSLRNKFNQNGRMDYQAMEIARTIHHLKFAIGNLTLCFTIGLTDFESVKTPHGPVGLPQGGRWTPVDMMFFYFVDNAFEHLYGFWNRSAHFLNIFFNVEPIERKVLFPSIIGQLASKVKKLNSDLNFQSLKEFRDTDYSNFNAKRARIVHKQCSWSTYFIETSKNLKNLCRLADLQSERDKLPGFFLDNFKRAKQGIDEIVGLIRDNVK
ncbi:MAG: hypothetical protein AMJ89_03290 [candidate division Zixibacteria bacterium SM23_73]|nr:MAG: hypothetical protein AMJ89_03290 [candidate division Zixibacteria bacterium SM23_73]